jgi:hypothetical protein
MIKRSHPTASAVPRAARRRSQRWPALIERWEAGIGAHHVADDGDLGAHHQVVLGQRPAGVDDVARGRHVPAGRDAQQGGLA